MFEHVKYKGIWTYSPGEKKVRLFRIMWRVNGGPDNQGEGYDACLSVSLALRLFAYVPLPARIGWALYLPGLNLRWHRSYGGRLW